MDQDSTHIVAASKVPMLKPVIENGNAPPTTKVVKGVETTIAPITAEEKAQRRLELKAISTLLMGIPNEYQLKFNSIKDAKSLLQAVKKSISQKDVNQKFLRSLSPEWNTHIIVWRNKPKIDTLSLDDLYNNLKIYEPKVKGTSSLTTNTPNVAFVSSNITNSTNGVVNTAHGATTASTQATAINSTTIDNLSNVVIRAFFANGYANNEGSGYNWSDQENFIPSITCQILDKCKISLRYNAVPPPYTRNFMPPKLDLTFSSLEEFVNDPIVSEPTVKKPAVKTSEAKASADKSKAVRKNNGAPIIEDWVSDYEEEHVPQTKIEKKLVKSSFAKIKFVKPKQQEKTARKTEKGVIDSGCSRHMTWNMSYLTDFEEINGGYVAFRGNPKRGKITSRGKIKTGNLDFENVYFLTDESHVLLEVPRKNNMYSVDLKNIVPKEGLTCLFAKAIFDESKLWHKRLGQINFKTINKLVKGNLIRGLPLKLFENNQTCVACQKGKQHRASCKSKTVSSISQPLHMLHMDLFGPTFVKSLMKKMYCLVVIDDYSRFSWVFFLATKDETSGILKSFITGVENLIDQRVKQLGVTMELSSRIKENEIMFCERKDHLGKFDGKADEGFFVRYSINSKAFRVKVGMETVPGKDYILLLLWTADLLFSQSSKSPQDDGSKPSSDDEKKVDEDPRKDSEINIVGGKLSIELPNDPNMHALEDYSIFDLSSDDQDNGAEADMNNLDTTIQMDVNSAFLYGKIKEEVYVCQPPGFEDPYFLTVYNKKLALGFMRPFGYLVTILNTIDHLGKFDGKADEGFFVRYSINSKAFRVFNSRSRIVDENLHVHFSEDTPNIAKSRPDWLFDIDALTRTMNYKPIIAGTQSNGDAGTKACDDAGKARMETVPGKDYILLLLWTADLLFSQSSKSPQDDGSKPSSDDEKKVDEDPRKDSEINVVGGKTSIKLPNDPNMHALEDYSIFDLSSDDQDNGVEVDMNNLDTTIQEELLQFKLQEVWTLVELPNGKWAIGIDYDEIFAPVSRIEAIRLFLAYASFKDFVVYQMDVNSAFLYGKIKEEVYVCQPPGFEDPYFLDRMSSRGELTFFLGLQVKQKNDGIFISQDKYVAKILKKFGFTEVKTVSTPMETQNTLLKDEDGEELDVHLYRSMIGSLMYLTSSTPDIMFAVCACARYQVNPKVSHLHAMKRIFRYLKGQPKLGLWYPKDSPFDLVAYTNSDYAGASVDRKSTTRDLLTKAFNVKTVNGEVQLQALMDGKKIIITESIVRRDLQLEDAEGVDCLPNATIFEQLTLMGPMTTTWNESSSIMASAIICLATNQKFNFSKLIFKSIMKNLDNVSGKFLMYPRFVQVFLDQQLDDMSIHKRIYVAPSHSKKVFANMRRVGKGFSSKVVQAQQEQGEGSIMPTNPQHTPTITQPSISQPKMTQKPRKLKKNTEVPQPSGSTKHVADEAVYKELDDSLVRAATTASSLEAEQDSGNIINTRSKEAPNETGSQRTTSGGGPRRQDTMGDIIVQSRFENVSKTSNDSLLIGDASKQGRKIDDIDKDAEITLVDETQGRYGDDQMFDTSVLDDEEVFVGQDMAEKEIIVAEKEVSTADPVTTAGEVVTTTSVEISTASPTETIITDDLTLA
ncbi:retrovirus-related pol polyprotein from transposon TNT 1-94 [Tanacetum coccineum]|uniref:Retrovirus-related pol polyprotein from transposon TNT 1-94 n=1 Tax=Tanacetum coccineum TaxID=301880 RepID=A0ABQ5CDH8_9ASTR